MFKLTWFILLLLTISSNAFAEHIEMPSFPDGLDRQEVYSEPNTLIGAFIASFALTTAAGGKVIFFPLARLTDAKILHQLATPGQTPDKAVEVFTISLHERSDDTEDQAITDLISALGKQRCPNQTRKVTAKNGVTLVQSESENCYRPGHHYSLSRFIKGKSGLYQIVYISRKVAIDAIDSNIWTERLAQARLTEQSRGQ